MSVQNNKVLITSIGTGSPLVLAYLQKEIRKNSSFSCAVVVTAHPQKSEARHIKSAFQALRAMGFKDVFYFDFDTGNRNLLKDVGCLYVSGGNTFYLLDSINKNNYTGFIKEYIQLNGMYIGVSAGACILGNDIQHLSDSGIDENLIGLKETQGLSIVDKKIVPHSPSNHMNSDYLNIANEGGYTFSWKDGSLVELTLKEVEK